MAEDWKTRTPDPNPFHIPEDPAARNMRRLKWVAKWAGVWALLTSLFLIAPLAAWWGESRRDAGVDPMHSGPWELMSVAGSTTTSRAEVHGGWIVSVSHHVYGVGVTFVPDAEHAWEVGDE